MAGSHETNPNTEIATASKKSKSKSGKSGHHSKSGQVHKLSGKSGQTQEQQEQSGRSEQHHHEQSKRKGKKRVQFSEEPSSKRQRVEDDPSVYKDGPLEAVSGKIETAKPYFNTGMFIDLNKIDDLGFPHLREYLEKYMCWLGINQEYNINVLRVFFQSLTSKAKYKKVDGKDQIRKVTFTATVRGRTFSFTWRDINHMMGVPEGEMNE